MGHSVAAALPWSEIQKYKPVAQGYVVKQVLYMWKRGLKVKSHVVLWGDEVEHSLGSLDHQSARVTALLDQAGVLSRWVDLTPLDSAREFSSPVLQPEYAAYMVESIPQKPYGEDIESLLKVESDLKRRKSMVQGLFSFPNQHVVDISVFPNLEIDGQFTSPYHVPTPTDTLSCMLPQEICAPLTRHRIAERNILTSRGRPIEVNVPIFRDNHTPWPFQDRPPSAANSRTNKPEVEAGCIYLDGFAYGPGSCCIQETFQVADEPTARWLHDQFIPLGPIMLALTAATPIYKAFLADSDVRWNWIPASPHKLQVDLEVRQKLIDGGMDKRLATHFACILSWSPWFISDQDLTSFCAERDNIFDHFQSYVYQHVRLKYPPPGDNEIGWRVEFRPMEVQPREFDNAAFLLFTFLLSRVVVTYELNLYIPIEKVLESMDTAHKRDSVLYDRLWFRRTGCLPGGITKAPETEAEPSYVLMTAAEIINGEDTNAVDGAAIPGLISIIWVYLGLLELSEQQKSRLSAYLDLVNRRASGQLPTPARWMRSFVMKHPDYHADSIVHQQICYDLMQAIVNGSND
ncbi:glutamate-cysteine ligase-domain-containing protein [Aspergillus avenaceus]|uniref:Glutamate--cysteine ligase n=1 Tax=Aspergillus avenaceus TaxID=36643 RepID=A0A5N6U4W5_ASPAV|nr:glutamate-cysteine ligase-domain-containing protein [Aspergillus avenaceus]